MSDEDGNHSGLCARCWAQPRLAGGSYCYECRRNYEKGMTPNDVCLAALRATGRQFEDVVPRRVYPPGRNAGASVS